MDSEEKIYSIKIFNKSYQIKCLPHEYKELEECAKILDHKMHSIHKAGNVLGHEKIAITAALNIARDLLKEYNKKVEAAKRAQSKIERLEEKLYRLSEKV